MIWKPLHRVDSSNLLEWISLFREKRSMAYVQDSPTDDTNIYRPFFHFVSIFVTYKEVSFFVKLAYVSQYPNLFEKIPSTYF